MGIGNLSLTVFEGEIFGFLGSNGAGKTTTIRTLMNLLFPTSGRAEIFEKDIIKHHLQITPHIGYLPGSVRPHKQFTGNEFLEYMGRLSIAENPHQYNDCLQYRHYLLEKFTLGQRDLERKIKEYSSGMAQKIALVQTFQHRPKLVIMDEPTEGLDPVMQETFYEILQEYRNNGGTVFLSSHHLREVEIVCDRAAIIREGRLVAIEKIGELENHTKRSIVVEFKEELEANQLQNQAWQITALDTHINKVTGLKETRMTATVTGEMDVIIKFLGKFAIKDISLPVPSLQDVFLHYYR